MVSVASKTEGCERVPPVVWGTAVQSLQPHRRLIRLNYIHPTLQFTARMDSSPQFSLNDKEWELIDPNPDIRELFLSFNDTFFQGKLSGIEVIGKIIV